MRRNRRVRPSRRTRGEKGVGTSGQPECSRLALVERMDPDVVGCGEFTEVTDCQFALEFRDRNKLVSFPQFQHVLRATEDSEPPDTVEEDRRRSRWGGQIPSAAPS